MKKFNYLLILIAVTVNISAQVSHKLGLRLYNRLQQPEYAQSNTLRPLLVQGNPSMIQALVEQYHGVYKYSAGDVSSVAIPYKNIFAFSQSKAVERIDANEAKGMALMDTARIVNNIDSALLGIAPLAQAYKGTGVLIGIIDGGIYFRHQDFKRANGNTRILNIWDQANTSGTAPAPYNYGTDWDTVAINSGNCSHIEPSSDQGHGTNVAGVAAGNGSSFAGHPFLNNRYTGAAPDADMIVVSLNPAATDFEQGVVDAVDYIFKKASSYGRPCVVNTSVGTYYGSHDGTELATKAIETLLDASRGRVLVAAGGNGGAIKHHVSYTISPTDSLFTWFTYNATTHDIYFDFWADTLQFKQAKFALGCDNNTPAFQARTRYFNVVTDFHPAQGATVQINDSLFQGSTKLGTYTIAVSLIGNLYHVEFQAVPVVTTNYWRLQTMGQGRFDLWASKSLINTSSVLNVLPNGFTSPNYRFGDSLKTIVSGWQCSDKVITVANYSNRAGYIDKDSNYVNLTLTPYFETVGGLFSTSSLGPTRDGRMKPDIAATGSTTTATGDSTYIANLIGSGQGYKVSYGSKHTRNGGTSMSSPLVAGIVALYLQEHPNATYSEVKRVLEVTAKKDNFTTFNIPNIQFGWGKVNGYQALKYQIVYGCTDTGSINYHPSANWDDGSCIGKIYGCIDPNSINYNPFANWNDGSCIPKVYGVMDTHCVNYNVHANVSSGQCIHVGIIETNSSFGFDVVPNPMGGTASIRIASLSPLTNSLLRVYDLLGSVVDEMKLSNAKEFIYSNTKLSAGIYTFGILNSDKLIAVKKVVVE